jgi:hypothetical protein
MNFAPQPYPLYAAYWDADKIAIALIVGWSAPAGDDLDPSHIEPIALFRNDDGSSTEPKYIDLDGEDPYWLGTSPDLARSQAKDAQEAV